MKIINRMACMPIWEREADAKKKTAKKIIFLRWFPSVFAFKSLHGSVDGNAHNRLFTLASRGNRPHAADPYRAIILLAPDTDAPLTLAKIGNTDRFPR
jgi:hypothetical protein